MTINEPKRKIPRANSSHAEPRSIPRVVVGRMAIYMREVDALLEEGCALVSSHTLAQRIGVSSAQVRKDLSYFGDFGKQGSGYDVAALHSALSTILHIDREWSVVLVGVGHLGRALIHNDKLRAQGFRIDAVFDNDRSKVGRGTGKQQILGMREFQPTVEALNCRMGIITTPAHSAQRVADRMVAAGILSILNYAPTTIYVPETVHVQNIDPLLHLYQMTYHLSPGTLRFARQKPPATEPSTTSSVTYTEMALGKLGTLTKALYTE